MSLNVKYQASKHFTNIQIYCFCIILMYRWIDMKSMLVRSLCDTCGLHALISMENYMPYETFYLIQFDFVSIH